MKITDTGSNKELEKALAILNLDVEDASLLMDSLTLGLILEI